MFMSWRKYSIRSGTCFQTPMSDHCSLASDFLLFLIKKPHPDFMGIQSLVLEIPEKAVRIDFPYGALHQITKKNFITVNKK